MNSTNFLHEHIDLIDTEITWLSDDKLKNEFNKTNIKFNRQNIILSNWAELEVFFDSLEYYELLDEKFTFINNKTENSLWTLYFCSSNEVSDIWNIIMEEKTAYVIWDGFWILKSAISGIATLMLWEKEAILPIHWSAISSKEIWWLSFVWWHRVWKTTWLLNISDILWSWEIVSDDWLLAKFLDWKLNVTSTDNSISVSSKSIFQNCHIFRINSFDVRNDVLKRKKSYKPEDLLWNWYYPHTKEVNINNTTLLINAVKNGTRVLND